MRSNRVGFNEAHSSKRISDLSVSQCRNCVRPRSGASSGDASASSETASSATPPPVETPAEKLFIMRIKPFRPWNSISESRPSPRPHFICEQVASGNSSRGAFHHANQALSPHFQLGLEFDLRVSTKSKAPLSKAARQNLMLDYNWSFKLGDKEEG